MIHDSGVFLGNNGHCTSLVLCVRQREVAPPGQPVVEGPADVVGRLARRHRPRPEVTDVVPSGVLLCRGDDDGDPGTVPHLCRQKVGTANPIKTRDLLFRQGKRIAQYQVGRPLVLKVL